MKNPINSYSLILVLAVIAGLTSCSQDEGERSDQVPADIELIISHLDTLGVVYASESNVYYQVIEENPTGNTQGATGDILTIFYSAKVLGGSDIEVITRESNQDSVMLRQGASAIYPVGLDIGLGLMKEGEKFIFYLPSDLALQDYSFSTLIPANSILQIEVELVRIHSDLEQLTEETQRIENYIHEHHLDSANLDSTLVNGVYVKEWKLYHPLDSVELISPGVYYKRTSEGVEESFVRGGDELIIAFEASTLDGETFDQRSGADPFRYIYQDESIMSGLEAGLLQMEASERSSIIIPSIYGYGESVFVVPSYLKQDFADLDIIPSYAVKVAPFEVLVFDTQLLNISSN